MAEFNAVTLAGTDFEDAATIQQVHNSAGGSFYITGGSVYYNLQYPIPQGRGKPIIWTQFEWTPDRLLPTGPGEIPPGVMGVRFKNADATVPATVTAAIADPGQPVLSVSSPGTVASAPSAAMVTGDIPRLGNTATAGTGFTYTHTNGTGVYVYSFTTAFAATPDVQVTSKEGSLSLTVSVSAVTSGGFTVTMRSSATGGVTDGAHNFLALPIT